VPDGNPTPCGPAAATLMEQHFPTSFVGPQFLDACPATDDVFADSTATVDVADAGNRTHFAAQCANRRFICDRL
jgi:hypothetical protein